jgi:hypothetical protein
MHFNLVRTLIAAKAQLAPPAASATFAKAVGSSSARAEPQVFGLFWLLQLKSSS